MWFYSDLLETGTWHPYKGAYSLTRTVDHQAQKTQIGVLPDPLETFEA